MSLLHEQTPIVTVDFRLPANFRAPQGGEHETVVSVKVVNSKSPINVKDWRHSSIFDVGWKFSFPHHYSDVGVKYQINVQMFHDQQPLLVELNYFVIVNKAPHRQTLHLSPIGFLYVEVQEPRAIAEHEAVTISLHDADNPNAELASATHDEQTATSFYMEYDPDSVVAGKRYTLSGIENRYHQSILSRRGMSNLPRFRVTCVRDYRIGFRSAWKNHYVCSLTLMAKSARFPFGAGILPAQKY